MSDGPPTTSPRLQPLRAPMPRPAADARKTIERIVAYWNEIIPRNHVRRLTDPRVRDVQVVLEQFTEAEICEAIAFYGGQNWQRDNQAWKTFDGFCQVPVITEWWERSGESAELHRRAEARSAAGGVPPEPSPEERDWEDDQAARERFKGLADDARRKLCRQAGSEMAKMGIRQERQTGHAVKMRAITIMKRRERERCLAADGTSASSPSDGTSASDTP